MTDDFQLNDEELKTALKILSGMVRDQLITVNEAAKRAGLTEEEFVERTKGCNIYTITYLNKQQKVVKNLLTT